MTTRTHSGGKTTFEGQPRLKQRMYEIQTPQQVRQLPIELSEEARKQSIEMLNQVLADSITLYHLYKKHHWQVAGPTFYQLHLLFDKHAEEILQTVDLIGERIQMLGGVALGMPFDVVERTRIERPPSGAESVPSMLARLLEAHRTVIKGLRQGIELTEQSKDYGTNDMLMSDILRMHEMHVWFISQHLVDTPLVGEDGMA
ncbi:MAG: DNA starvation/stationary phase protection protein [Thermogemmatispora sp.]|uniref:Dps family protein n=1 Tax=Thermogemmatispora sp. TaxID=1968838 RepID=UPI00263A3744|nr:DNA starvation/stationary phase protection protein [Thermogemmatispora sp.]MBX5458840.1 DNA starvation/stationary phase protection protein [Thermogemmatispora sp.]